MAKKKRKAGKQGIVSWTTSIIGLGIGLGNVAARAIEAAGDWQKFIDFMVMDYTGYDAASGSFAIENAARGYVPIVGAIVFKKGTSELIKRCKVQSIMPSFS